MTRNILQFFFTKIKTQHRLLKNRLFYLNVEIRYCKAVSNGGAICMLVTELQTMKISSLNPFIVMKISEDFNYYRFVTLYL